jgi:hypothetical protein
MITGYRDISGDAVRKSLEAKYVKLNKGSGLRSENIFDAAIEGTVMHLYVRGEDVSPIRTPSMSLPRCRRGVAQCTIRFARLADKSGARTASAGACARSRKKPPSR